MNIKLYKSILLTLCLILFISTPVCAKTPTITGSTNSLRMPEIKAGKTVYVKGKRSNALGYMFRATKTKKYTFTFKSPTATPAVVGFGDKDGLRKVSVKGQSDKVEYVILTDKSDIRKVTISLKKNEIILLGVAVVPKGKLKVTIV